MIEYNGVKKIKDNKATNNIFEDCTDELITAVNKGIKFGDNNKTRKVTTWRYTKNYCWKYR